MSPSAKAELCRESLVESREELFTDSEKVSLRTPELISSSKLSRAGGVSSSVKVETSSAADGGIGVSGFANISATTNVSTVMKVLFSEVASSSVSFSKFRSNILSLSITTGPFSVETVALVSVTEVVLLSRSD